MATHDPASIWFHPVAEDGYIDLIVYHPHYSEAQRGRFDNALYILLDMALGEFDVIERWAGLVANSYNVLPMDAQTFRL